MVSDESFRPEADENDGSDEQDTSVDIERALENPVDQSESILIDIEPGSDGPWNDSVPPPIILEDTAEAGPGENSGTDSAERGTVDQPLILTSPRKRPSPKVRWFMTSLAASLAVACSWWCFSYFGRARELLLQGITLSEDDPDTAMVFFQKAIKQKPEFSRAYCEMGKIHVLWNDFDAAAICFETAARLDPESGEAHYLLGKVLIENNQPNSAIKELSHAVFLEYEKSATYYLRGQAKEKRDEVDDLDKAINDYTLALKDNPGHLDARYRRGLLYFRQQEQAKAISDFSRVVEAKAEHIGALLHRARARHLAGETDAALEDYNRVIKLDSGDHEVFRERALLLAETGKTAEAIEDLTIVIKLRPSAESYIQRGRLRSRHGDPKGAISDYSAAIRLDTRNATAYGLRGLLRMRAGNYIDALVDFTRSLELEPDQDTYVLASARCYVELNQLDRAIASCSDLIRLDPLSVEAHLIRGLAFLRQGQPIPARKDFSTVIELDKENSEAYRSRGQILMQEGKLEQAIQDLTTAIDIDPQDVVALMLRGDIFSLTDRPTDAAADYREIIKLEPDNLQALHGRAAAFVALKKYNTAAMDFSSILRITPQDSKALVGRARCYLRLEDYDGAIADYAQASESGSGTADEINSEYAMAHMARGNLAFKNKRYEYALHDYVTAIQIDPSITPLAKDAMASLFLAQAQLLPLDTPENLLARRELLDSVLERRPTDQLALRLRGEVNYRLGEFNKSIADYGRAIKLDPDETHSLIQRGRSYRRIGELEKAIDDFTAAIQINKKLDVAFIERAQTYLRNADFSAAITDFFTAVKINPGNLALVKNDYAIAHQLRADSHYQAKAYAKAVVDYRQALVLDASLADLAQSKYALSHFQLGQKKLEDDNPKDALSDFILAKKIDPSLVAALVGRGNCHLHLNLLAAAYSDFSEVIADSVRDKSVHIDAYFGRAEVSMAEQKWDRAISDLTRGLALQPTVIRRSEFLTHRGRCYSSRKSEPLADLGKSIHDFEDAIEINVSLRAVLRAELVNNHRELGLLLLKEFDLKPGRKTVDDAIEHLQSVIRVDPTVFGTIQQALAGAHHRSGQLFYQDGDYAAAVTEYLEADRIDPKIKAILANDLSNAFNHLGLQQLRQDDFIRAIENLKQAISWNKNLTGVVQAPLATALAKLAYLKITRDSLPRDAVPLLEEAGRVHPGFTANLELAQCVDRQLHNTPTQDAIFGFELELMKLHDKPRFYINSKLPPANTRQQLDTQFVDARLLAQQGKLKDAILVMDGVIQQGWPIPLYYYYRGWFLQKFAEPEKALLDFQVGSFLEATGYQDPGELNKALGVVQGADRKLLQDQRKRGESMLVEIIQDRSRVLAEHLSNAKEETRRLGFP